MLKWTYVSNNKSVILNYMIFSLQWYLPSIRNLIVLH